MIQSAVYDRGARSLATGRGGSKTADGGRLRPATVQAPARSTCDAGGERVLSIVSDAKFHIHCIDASGKEISLEEAQKRAGKK
jgi:hypothetical protein